MTDREKPYICVDVDLPRNERLAACNEPLACLGLWVALASYSREQLTDGMVPIRLAETMCGERSGKRLAQMVKEGLLAKTDTHFEVLRYAPRNQTKAAVEAARKGARDRQQVSRSKRALLTGESHVTDGVTHQLESGDSYPTRGRARTSTSLSLSESESGERVQGEPPWVTGRPQAGLASPPPEAYEITEANRANAAMAGAPVPRAEHVVKFLANARSKRLTSYDWPASFDSWMASQKRFEQSSGRGGAAPATDVRSPSRRML